MDLEPLPNTIAELVVGEMRRLDVPGVTAGVVWGGHYYAQGFGVNYLARPREVTPHTLFQVGSTSKTFTGTAAMILVDEGRLDVEAPVRRYLPAFRLKSEPDTAALTVRHLLTHHGGWAGDYFKDMGRGSDALALMCEKMADAPQISPAGFAFSYSNAGFNVLARIVEVASSEEFEEFISRRILQPLEMSETTYFPEDAILHSVAVGHARVGAQVVPSSRWAISRSIAGSSGIVSSVLDQLRYAAFHLGDGTAPSGERLLSVAGLRAMQSVQAPAGSMCDDFGLSFMIDHVPGADVVKHGGSISGQLSSFEFVPARGYGCTVLTNAEDGRELKQKVADACLRHFTGLERPIPAPDPSLSARHGEVAGHYVQRLADLDVRADGDGLQITLKAPPWLVTVRDRAETAVETFRAALFAPDRAVVLDGGRRGETCEFLRGSDGAVTFMRWDGRLSRRQ